MQSLTYRDIIDDKMAEWQSRLRKLEKYVETANSDTQAELKAKMKELKNAIDTAIIQLHTLDEHETVSNTMETKDEILKIFSSIDKNFVGYENRTPFML